MKEDEVDEPAIWHDPELPFLDVLEQQVRRSAERAAIRHQQRHHLPCAGQPSARSPLHESAGALAEHKTPPRIHAATSRLSGSRTRRSTGLQRASARIARRSLTLVVLLSLIGASAYGASRVFSGDGNPLTPHRGAYVMVASGRAGADSWKLRLYVRGDELCRELSLSESEASECASAPAARKLEATSAQSASRRYVFGVTGGLVRRVWVHVGAQSKTVSTYAPGPGQTSAGLPPHVRFFVATFPRAPRAGTPGARVQGLALGGRALGAPVPSCVETDEVGC